MIQETANAVPSELDEGIKGEVGKVLNTISFGGIIPSDQNNGGVIAQIPVLLGQGDINQKVIQAATEESELVRQNPDKFVKIQDSQYFQSLDPLQQQELKDLNVYVSKDPVDIDSANATYQNATNGMLNSEGLALRNAMQQTGLMVEQGDPTNSSVTLNYNPTHGFLGDFLESSTDTLPIWHTGAAKDTGEFVRDVTTAREDRGSNFNNHSQGNILTQQGIEYIQGKGSYEEGGFKAPEYFGDNHPTFASFGSPVNSNDMKATMSSVGFESVGSFTRDGDYVGEGLGGNKGEDEQASLKDRMNILNIPKLFSEPDESPHSTYHCAELEVANCGDGPASP